MDAPGRTVQTVRRYFQNSERRSNPTWRCSMGDGRMTVGNVEVSHLYDLVADLPHDAGPTLPDRAGRSVGAVPPRVSRPVRRGQRLALPRRLLPHPSQARTILVDTGVGPSSLGLATWLGTGGELPERLRAAGVVSRGRGDGGVHPPAPGPRRLESPAGGWPVPADLPARSLRGPPGGLGNVPPTRSAAGDGRRRPGLRPGDAHAAGGPGRAGPGRRRAQPHRGGDASTRRATRRAA